MNDVTGSMIRLDQSSFRPCCGNVCVCRRVRGVPLGMSRLCPEKPGSESTDRSVATDVLLREEPEEDEEDRDEEKDEDEGKEEDGEGYLE
jgi:hypothetical protein